MSIHRVNIDQGIKYLAQGYSRYIHMMNMGDVNCVCIPYKQTGCLRNLSTRRMGVLPTKCDTILKRNNISLNKYMFQVELQSRNKYAYSTSASGVNHVLKVPSLGDSITEGTVVEWKKNIGDFINADEVICVIETDKVSVDIHADISGFLNEKKAEADGVVSVGKDLAVIRPADASSYDKSQKSPKSRKSPKLQKPPKSHKSEKEGKLEKSGRSDDHGESGVSVNVENILLKSGSNSSTDFVGRRKPLILFRYALLKSGSAENLQSHISKVTGLFENKKGTYSDGSEDFFVSAGRKIAVERYEDISKLPSLLQRNLLTEEEVESVNYGANYECFNNNFGTWKTSSYFVVPQKSKLLKK